MGPVSCRRILITGASGTLGYNVVRLLSSDSRYQLFLPLRTPRPDLFDPNERLQVFECNLSDGRQTREIVARCKPDVVVHCAASGLRPPRPAWFEMTTFNVDATLRLFETCCAFEQLHFIYISTGLVYREQSRPLSEVDPIETLHPYGASKSAADSLLRAAAAEFDRKLTLLRPFSFTGLHDGGSRLFPSLLRAAAEQKPLDLSPGEQIRDFCSVKDIARAILAVIDSGHLSPIETLNLGSASCESLKELVIRVCHELNLTVDLRFGARSYHPYEPMHLVANIEKAFAVLGWRPCENVASSVWDLARSQFPALSVTRPRIDI